MASPGHGMCINSEPQSRRLAAARLQRNRQMQAQLNALIDELDRALAQVTVQVHVTTYASLPEPRADAGIFVSNEPLMTLRKAAGKPKALVSRFRRPVGAPFFVDYDRDVPPQPVAVAGMHALTATPTKAIVPWTTEERQVGTMLSHSRVP
jgi:hypothetical protein